MHLRCGTPDYMNSKEQLPSHTDAGASEIPELPDALKQALRDAYPDPNGRIAAKVMEQIRAEREDSERRTRADKAERRRRRQGLIMKYGGLAACMVILSGALVIASPLMDRSAENAAMDAAVGYAETIPETAAAVYSVYSTALTADENAGLTEAVLEGAAPEDAVLTEAEENVPMTAAAGKTKSIEIADTPTEEAVQTKLFLADTALAQHDDAAEESDTREAFLQYLIEEGYLTAEDFTQWQNTLADAATWTTADLCTAFQLDETLYDTWVKK